MLRERTRKNDHWLRALEALQDATEPTSNMHMVYRKAIRSLKQEKEEIVDWDSLSKVNSIGNAIIAKLKDIIQFSGSEPSGRQLLSSSSLRQQKYYTAPSSEQPQKRHRQLKKAQSTHDFDEEVASEQNMPFFSGQNTTHEQQDREIPATEVAHPSHSAAHNNRTTSSFGDYFMQHEKQQGTKQQTSPVSFLEGHSRSFFQFDYLDTANNPVKQSHLACLDVAQSKVWLKICLCARGIGPEHHILPHLRNGPSPDKLDSDNLFVCWLAEETVNWFSLESAPGVYLRGQGSNITAASSSSLEQHALRNLDFEDLISSEKRSKNVRTLDPSRKVYIGKEWETPSLEARFASTSNSQRSGELVFNESTGGNSRPSRASITGAPVLASKTASSQPSLRRAVMLSEPDSVSEKSAGRLDAPSLTTASWATKRRNRGRVSDFVPAPAPVDDFDKHLDIIAASQNNQSDSRKAVSSSCISADMMEDVADLTMGSQSFAPFDPILFPAGSFDIVLILDTRERAYENRNHILIELQEKGVNVEQRALVLGDVLWIARSKVPLPNAVNECILGYILERKRLDDLCQSITNGRFHEQKFRLSNTGLKVFYLIEDYNNEEQREKWAAQIDTARSSIQIVDGFILKETRALRHTIEYLTIMHTIITNAYQDKTLHVIPPELIKRYSYLALQKHLRETEPANEYMTSYNCFEKLNHKTNNLTSRDLFAQMLLCVKGVSAEKAAVIINHFPTLRSLWDAFREAEVVETTAKLSGTNGRKKIPKAAHILCSIEGKGRKKIGPALSESIYKLLRADNYDTRSCE